ncbi:inosine-uridine preferring nucleoside hydrolase-like [Babylonia areolata]|uniref:inosine-uridine preferring nucleoside hydrolase-like n=1 Tax=Babylonia areolata TaxID=304850 RepID=UPI003FD3A972
MGMCFWVFQTSHLVSWFTAGQHAWKNSGISFMRPMLTMDTLEWCTHSMQMCPVCAHTFKKTPKGKKSKDTSATSDAPSDTASASFISVVLPDASGRDEGGDEGEGEVMAVVQKEEEGGDMDTTEVTCEEQTENPENPVTEASPEDSTAAVAATSNTTEVRATDIRLLFTCHLCDMSFEKKLLYQRHIRAHKEHAPRIPFVSPYKSPPVLDKRRVKQERRSYTTMSRGRQVIIDGDMGVEACQALMLALWRSDLLVVGITCTNGVVNIDRACNNALKVLTVCERDDVPVFCGAERPLVGRKTRSAETLPGPSWNSTIDNSQLKSEHAVSAMIRMVSEQPGKISLVCLGPVTNLALALRLDPNMPKKLKEVVIVGGNIEGRGDGSMCAEQNFYHDPEAAFAVLEEIPNITLLPFEVCDRHRLTGDFFDSWVHLGTTRSEFVRGMGEEDWLKDNQHSGYTPYCAYAVAVVADHTIALEKRWLYATVELSGALSRGMMVVDWAKRLGNESNVEVVRSLDLGKIQSLLIGMVEDPEAMEVYTVG